MTTSELLLHLQLLEEIFNENVRLCLHSTSNSTLKALILFPLYVPIKTFQAIT